MRDYFLVTTLYSKTIIIQKHKSCISIHCLKGIAVTQANKNHILKLKLFLQKSSLHSTPVSEQESMPPRNIDVIPCHEVNDLKTDASSREVSECKRRLPKDIVWRNVAWMFYLHVAAAYGLSLFPLARAKTCLLCK